jgi:hypothetical protein
MPLQAIFFGDCVDNTVRVKSIQRHPMNITDPVATGVALAGALQIAKQGQELIAAAFGHPGESIGTMLGNLGRRRIQNVEAVGNKAHLILLNIGVTPQEADLNVVQPLLEGASLQENPSMQEIWANLLANATDPRKQNPVAASFRVCFRTWVRERPSYSMQSTWIPSKDWPPTRLGRDLKTPVILWKPSATFITRPDSPPGVSHSLMSATGWTTRGSCNASKASSE